MGAGSNQTTSGSTVAGSSKAISGKILDSNAYDRHSMKSRPIELNINPKDTYNDKFMALMQSPCRPEHDGYFGATSGDPVKITYGFQMETKPLTTIVNLLELIEDKVADKLLSTMYPDDCGFRRRLLGHRASGLRFYKFQEQGE